MDKETYIKKTYGVAAVFIEEGFYCREDLLRFMSYLDKSDENCAKWAEEIELWEQTND